jgi:hypothetical protein
MEKGRIDKDKRKEFDGILIYFWWSIWKRKKPKNISAQRATTDT